MLNLSAIAARLAAAGDSAPLVRSNKKNFVWKAVQQKGDPVPAEARRELDEAAQKVAPEGFDSSPFSLEVIQTIESIPDRALPPKSQRKYFILWLAGELAENGEIPIQEIETVSRFFSSEGHKTEVLKGKSFDEVFNQATARGDLDDQTSIPRNFDPETFLSKVRTQTIDGLKIAEIRQSSDPDPGKIRTFLERIGDEMGICIGSNYGDLVSRGSMEAFIGFDSSGKPVAAILVEGPEIREIKGRHNSFVEDRRFAVPLLKFILSNFSVDQFEEAEGFWVPLTLASFGLDSTKFSGLSRETRDFVDSVSALKSTSPSSMKDRAIQAILSNFEGFSIDDLLEFEPHTQLFLAILNKVPKSTLFEISRRLVESDKTGPVVDVLVQRLREKILSLPLDRNIFHELDHLSKTHPAYKKLASDYAKKFDPHDSSQAIEAAIKNRDSSAIRSILSRHARDLTPVFAPDFDPQVSSVVSEMSRSESRLIPSFLAILPSSYFRDIRFSRFSIDQNRRSLSPKQISQMIAGKIQSPKGIEDLVQLVQAIPETKFEIIRHIGVRDIETILPYIRLDDQLRSQIVKKTIVSGLSASWFNIILAARNDGDLAKRGLIAALDAGKPSVIEDVLSAWVVARKFNDEKAIVEELRRRLEMLRGSPR